MAGKKSFRLGEKVEVNIQADYYFGGPVSNAAVEVVVYQNPFITTGIRAAITPGTTPTLKKSTAGSITAVRSDRQTRDDQTDATGKAVLTFDTPRENYNQDFEYRIEARVTTHHAARLSRVMTCASPASVITSTRARSRTSTDRKIRSLSTSKRSTPTSSR